MPVEQTENIIKKLKLSVSKVKTFDQCKKKYHYTYEMRLPRKTWAFHTLGKFVHLVLEEFHKSFLSGSDEPLNVVMGRAYRIAMKEYGKSMSEDSKKEAFTMIDGYLQKITNEKHTLKDVIAVEKNFSFPISDHIILNGMIDKIQIDHDGILNVGDYKTTRDKRYLKDDWLQLQTYAYVLATEDPSIQQIRGSYILVRHNFERIEKVFNIDEIMEIKSNFETYAKDIEDEQLWEANPTRLCGYCDHLAICKEGTDFMNKINGNTNTFGSSNHGEVKW